MVKMHPDTKPLQTEVFICLRSDYPRDARDCTSFTHLTTANEPTRVDTSASGSYPPDFGEGVLKATALLRALCQRAARAEDAGEGEGGVVFGDSGGGAF